jgi:hypothetical protein
MRRQFPLLTFLLFVLLAAGVALYAQTCPPSVAAAITSIGTACNNLDVNSACYGNFNVQASFAPGFDAGMFDQPSERAPLDAFQSIRTAPYTSTEWGVAVLKMQANIPNALPGQAVTVLLLGDVQLQSLAGSSAFTFTTGVGAPSCAQIPPSSLIVQGPRGLVVDLTINGANVRLGSTMVLRTNDRSIQFATLDGRVVINGETIISKGFRAFAELDDEGLIIEDSWGEVEVMDAEELELFEAYEELPDELFDYEVDLPDAEEIELMEMLGFDLLDSLDPYTLDEMVAALLADGIDPDALAEMGDDEFFEFLYNSVADDDPALGDAFYEAFTGEDVDGDGLIAGFDIDAYYSGDDFYAYGDEFEGIDFEVEGDEEPLDEEEFTDEEPSDEEDFSDEEPLDEEEFTDEEPPADEGGGDEEGGEEGGGE